MKELSLLFGYELLARFRFGLIKPATTGNLFIRLDAGCSLLPTSQSNPQKPLKTSIPGIFKKPAVHPLLVVSACIVAMFLCLGCAHVTFSSTPDMKNPIPLHFYAEAIPYLLVSKSKDGATATIFYLKDPKSIVYAQQHQGWGTANFTMSLSNGVLSAYGMQTDSKGPETIAAVASLLSSAASAGLAGQAGPDYSAEGDKLQAAVTSFNAATASLPLTDNAKNIVDSLVKNLSEAASTFKNPTLKPNETRIALSQLKGARADLAKLKGEEAIKSSGDASADKSKAKTFEQAKQAFGNSLIAILSDVEAPTEADVQLYQIKQRADGKISLIPASFPKG